MLDGLFNTRSKQSAVTDMLDEFTSLEIQMEHYMEIANVLSAKIVLFDRISDKRAFKEICRTYAEDHMRSYFDDTDESQEKETERIKYRAMATAINDLSEEYERLVQLRSKNSVNISQTQQAIEDIKERMEAVKNG